MKNVFKSLILLLSLSSFGCTKTEEVKTTPKTGLEMVAIGSAANFGNVTIGEYKEATVRLHNYGPEVITGFDITTLLQAPFSAPRVTAPCNSGSIPVGVDCLLTIRFTPTVKSKVETNIIIGNKSLLTVGTGLDSAGVLNYSVSSWDLATVIAGVSSIRDISVTNSGDFTVQTPTSTTVAGYTRTLNECGTFIAPKRTCLMRYTIIKQTLGPQTDTLTFSAPDTSSFNVTVTSIVIPGPPSGSIVIISPPVNIVADGGIASKVITIAPIRDQFNNIVLDGTEVSILTSNVTVVGPALKSTVGGTASFNIISTNQIGDATVTILAGSATGFTRFKSIAGPAVGDIVAKPYIANTEANGLSQIDISFSALRDQFNNVVEDGTPVYFSLRPEGTTCLNPGTIGSGTFGTGTLMSSVSNTILGEVKATIIPPTITGRSVLVAQSGTACGAYTVNFVPGDAAGTISVASNIPAIYADPATGLATGETIQSTITVGPVRDQFGNIIATSSPISIVIQNAIGVVSGTQSFSVTTNSSGLATFPIQGLGSRGYITISASKDTASGSTKVWAYGNATLRPDRPNLSTNPFKLFMTYHSVLTNPQLENNWGVLKSWNNLDIQDKNYYGDLKKQAPPTLVDSQLPYVVTYCLFSAGNITYGSNCFKDNFNDSSIYQNTVKLTKGNKPLDPGASLLTLNLNTARGLNLHQETTSGCYKQDLQPGSLTYGVDILYPGASQERCNGLTSSDPTSPVYNNYLNSWFNGTWVTKTFDLKHSTVGFIPDLAKVLTFGGFYENAIYGGGAFPNYYQVFMSNKNTWSTNYGIDAPFNWVEENNLEDIYGAFPEKSVMPSVTNSNKDLFMFGGLLFRGVSSLNGVAVNDYIQSTASDLLSVFDGIVNKWFTLSPSSDPLITNSAESKSPTARYQNGMVYISDTDTLFLAGGKGRDLVSNAWTEPNDMWSIANITNKDSLQWKRRCFPCGFPVNAHAPSVSPPVDLNPSTVTPTPLKMAYNPYLQKVFMVWSGTNYPVSSFDPLASSNLITVSHTNPYSFSSIEGSDLFDIEVNSDIGRTYFYKRKTPTQFDSEIYYWDMDPGTKQYIKIETDLGGSPAKDFVRSLGIHVRGYGSVMDSSQVVQGVGGIRVMVYNNVTAEWDLVGENSAKIESEDIPAQSVSNIFDATSAPKYINAAGKVNVLISPRDLSGYTGSGYNELRIDEFYIDGLF